MSRNSEMEVSTALSRFDAIGINIAVNDEKLVVTSPMPLTDPQRSFLKAHKVELLETLLQRELIEAACLGLEITPAQFTAICSEEDLKDISDGSTPLEELRMYAASFAHGIRTGRIVIHPKTQELVRHLTACQWYEDTGGVS